LKTILINSEPAETAGAPAPRARRARSFASRTALATCVALATFVAPRSVGAQAQGQQPGARRAAAAEPALRRTTTRREVRRFGFGNTFTIYGAPEGSITVEAWARPEIEIVADVELRANTEEEVARLAAVNNFVLDEDSTHFRLVTTGTHDRKYMQRAAKALPAAKEFPKHLLAMPWRVDYRVRVPAVVDLEVFAGRGALVFTGIEGALELHAGESRAALTLAGGDVAATLAGGTVLLRVPERSWRGRGAIVRLAAGQLTVAVPAGFNGEVEATVAGAGRVEIAEGALALAEGAQATERSLRARAGAGGARFTFEVGAGVIRFERLGGVRAQP
jgi:hypothetical protein